MHDVVQKAQRIVAADRARCRLDRINAPASGAPLALTGQRGHDAPRAEVRCGQQERHAKTTSAASDAEPGRPGPGRHRRGGPLVISRGPCRKVRMRRQASAAPERVTITGREDRSAPGAAGCPLPVDQGRERGRKPLGGHRAWPPNRPNMHVDPPFGAGIGCGFPPVLTAHNRVICAQCLVAVAVVLGAGDVRSLGDPPVHEEAACRHRRTYPGSSWPNASLFGTPIEKCIWATLQSPSERLTTIVSRTGFSEPSGLRKQAGPQFSPSRLRCSRQGSSPRSASCRPSLPLAPGTP